MLALTVSTFPNAKALPLWAAKRYGLFARHGLDVTLHETGSSREQRDLLAGGDIHICQSAIDNALAMMDAGHDVVIVMGGEGGMNDFIVQSDLSTFADIAGGVLLVDSPDTAYALLAQKLLASHGLLPERDYTMRPVGNGAKRLEALIADRSASAAVLNPPFSAQALEHGMHSLGQLDALLGPYQAGGAFALRAWAETNGECLEHYIAAYAASLEWLHDPRNSAAAMDLLQQHLDIGAALARATYHQLCDEKTGFTPQARLLPEGFSNTLKVRSAAMKNSGDLAAYRDAVDMTYYERALGCK